MNQEPYNPPKAKLEEETDIEIPEETIKKIKNAWVAGLISIVVTAAFTIIAMSGQDIFGLDATAFIDVGLMAIFTFGIYKNSRICAVLMLILFAANKIFLWMESGAASGIPLSLVFLWFYTQGVIGTFQYHKHVKNSLNKHSQKDVADAPPLL